MFQAMYEIFGLNPFYSANMAQLLSGWADICNEEFRSMQLYTFFGIIMLASTAFVYVLQYHIIDRARFSGPAWWWLFGGLAFVFNYVFALLYMLNLFKYGELRFDCDVEFFKVIYTTDFILFPLDNALWSLIFFALISCPPLFRKLSRNCFNTTAFTH